MGKVQARNTKKIISNEIKKTKNKNFLMDGDYRQFGKKTIDNSVNRKHLFSTNKIKSIKQDKFFNNKRNKQLSQTNRWLTIRVLQNHYPWHFGTKFHKFFNKQVRSLIGGDENGKKFSECKTFSPSTFDSESTFEEGFTKDDEMTSISTSFSTLSSETSISLGHNQKKSKHFTRSLTKNNYTMQFLDNSSRNLSFKQRKLTNLQINSSNRNIPTFTSSRDKIDSLLLIRKKLSKSILNDNLVTTSIRYQQHKDETGNEQNLPLITTELTSKKIEQLRNQERELLINIDDNLDNKDSILIKNSDMTNLSLSLTMDSEEQQAQLKNVLEIMKKLHAELSIK